MTDSILLFDSINLTKAEDFIKRHIVSKKRELDLETVRITSISFKRSEVYNLAEDGIALTQIQKCFPTSKLYPIDARCFIKQGGSVHCLTMQIPKAPRKT